ncbi:MAG TPA: bifunctional 2-polyprenyl-6-hydroxyphenol methylase/3-demethylubiquinol 3-O-methyltransferase UbiG [Polyangiales bacterium]
MQTVKLTKTLRPVNNEIYSTLGTRWYEASDDPVALLRAEAGLRNPWVARQIESRFGSQPCSVLDIGCGGGFLSNYLAGLGHRVTGLDAETDGLAVAARYDVTETVQYDLGDARALPYPSGSFDVVCAMDFLEHVENPDRVVAEIARVLKPSGLFFFHTFNRNWLAWLVVIKGVEWFVKNTPVDMHVLHLFLKPDEVRAMCNEHGLQILRMLGSRPELGAALWTMLRTGCVPADFQFTFSRSTQLAYTGFARKSPELA